MPGSFGPHTGRRALTALAASAAFGGLGVAAIAADLSSRGGGGETATPVQVTVAAAVPLSAGDSLSSSEPVRTVHIAGSEAPVEMVLTCH